MNDFIDHLKNHPSVGFAQTISADFTHPRHMSAGVAVSFRRPFGRPQNADYVDTKLSLQKVQNGASVYSLVTKQDFFLKNQLMKTIPLPLQSLLKISRRED